MCSTNDLFMMRRPAMKEISVLICEKKFFIHQSFPRAEICSAALSWLLPFTSLEFVYSFLFTVCDVLLKSTVEGS